MQWQEWDFLSATIFTIDTQYGSALHLLLFYSANIHWVPFCKTKLSTKDMKIIKIETLASRWRRSKTWSSPSSPQIHQKYNYMRNNSYRTPTERWQKTSDVPKGKKLPTYLGRAKEKSKNRDKRIGTGPAPWGGS